MRPGYVGVSDLAADHALNPLGLSSSPRMLSWKLNGSGRPQRTEVVAATSPELLSHSDIWSTALDGDVSWVNWPSDLELSARANVWWSARVLSTDGVQGDWAIPALFEIALAPDDWTSQWITHPDWTTSAPVATSLPAFSRSFFLGTAPAKARLYVTGLGVQETFVNGERIGGAYLEPGYADYSIRVPAMAWDVTPLLREGENVITASLGTGTSWVGRDPARYTKLEQTISLPRYLAQLEVELEDGTAQIITTDDSWSAWLSPVVSSHWYGGEDLREPDTPPEPVAAVQLGAVTEFPPPWFTTSAPVRVVELRSPVSEHVSKSGTRVIDFGTNIAGQVRAIIPPSEAGSVKFWPSELLNDHGDVDQTSTGTPIFDRLTRASSGAQSTQFRPSMSYHGFRYVAVTSDSDIAQGVEICAAVLRADLPVVGHTTTSDPFLNKLHDMIDRAVQGNMFSVFTDCPHREKLGWVEQLYLCFDVLARSYDVSAHLRQSLTHIRDAQLPSGLIPSIAPEMIDFSGDAWNGDPNAFRDDPNWSGVIAHLPWRLYETYADERALSENWDAIVKHVAYLDGRSVDGLLDYGLGDWVTTDATTPRSMVATYGYITTLEAAVKVAHTLGERDAATRFTTSLEYSRGKFRDAFWSADSQIWGSGSQASFALAFDLGLVDPDEEAATWDALLASINEARDLITVGEIGLPALLRTLTSHNADDLINMLIRQEHGPGYAHQVASGATALTESWQGPEGPAAQGSQNHFMLGIIDDWLTGTVCGLRQQAGSIGWRRVAIAPKLLQGVDWARTSFSSPTGEISVAWQRNARLVTVTATLPPGVSGSLAVKDTFMEIGTGVNSITVEE